MSKKEIQCRCWEPIAFDPNYEQPWSDVYIRYKTRPGHPVYYGPTLIGKLDLLQQLEINTSLQDPKEQRRIHDSMDTTMEPFELHDYADDIARTQEILTQLEAHPYVVESLWDENGFLHKSPKIPNIYTAADWINRAEAERMLTYLLQCIGLTHSVFKFRWVCPDICIIPT